MYQMFYQKESCRVLTGNLMINDPKYVITLCFQVENGSKWGKPCDISLTKNQLEMLYSALTNWQEFMKRREEESREELEEQERLNLLKFLRKINQCDR
jgi:hypothetical protein